MDNHISFGDLVAFVWMEELTPGNRELALRVNQHLIKCEECQIRLEQLEQIRQDAAELKDKRRKRDNAKGRMNAYRGKILPFVGREMQTIKFCAADHKQVEIQEEGVIHLDAFRADEEKDP